MDTRKGTQAQPLSSLLGCKSKGGQSWESSDLMCKSRLGLWGFGTLRGFFLACLSFLSSFLSFIQHGYCYLRVKKNSWHFAESSSKRLKYETEHQIWKGGGEKKKTTTAFCLPPLEPSSFNTHKTSWRCSWEHEHHVHHGDVLFILEMERNESSVFGPYNYFMKCQKVKLSLLLKNCALPPFTPPPPWSPEGLSTP